MSFKPTYACDGPTCVEEERAENDSELLLEGWLIITCSEAEGDPDAHEDRQLDFCSRDCLRAWLDDEGSAW